MMMIVSRPCRHRSRRHQACTECNTHGTLWDDADAYAAHAKVSPTAVQDILASNNSMSNWRHMGEHDLCLLSAETTMTVAADRRDPVWCPIVGFRRDQCTHLSVPATLAACTLTRIICLNQTGSGAVVVEVDLSGQRYVIKCVPLPPMDHVFSGGTNETIQLESALREAHLYDQLRLRTKQSWPVGLFRCYGMWLRNNRLHYLLEAGVGDLIEKPPGSWAAAGYTLCRGVACLHNQLGALIRDIKVDNVLYSSLDHTYKLLDWDKTVPQSQQPDQTRSPARVSFSLQPPEGGHRGRSTHYGAAADIWCLGVAICCSLAKRYRILTTLEERVLQFAVVHQLTDTQNFLMYRLTEVVRKHLPVQLQSIVMSMLDILPENRPTALEAAASFESHLTPDERVLLVTSWPDDDNDSDKEPPLTALEFDCHESSTELLARLQIIVHRNTPQIIKANVTKRKHVTKRKQT